VMIKNGSVPEGAPGRIKNGTCLVGIRISGIKFGAIVYI